MGRKGYASIILILYVFRLTACPLLIYASDFFGHFQRRRLEILVSLGQVSYFPYENNN